MIRDAYIIPLQTLWYTHGVGLVPSDRSCYRSVEYELSRGRSGRSLHTFPPDTKGACDLRLHNFARIEHVIDTVIEELPFRRIVYYPNNNFLHVDYGEKGRRSGDRRSLWVCAGPLQPWIRQSWLAGPLF